MMVNRILFLTLSTRLTMEMMNNIQWLLNFNETFTHFINHKPTTHKLVSFVICLDIFSYNSHVALCCYVAKNISSQRQEKNEQSNGI
jgi:hypothetical protein